MTALMSRAERLRSARFMSLAVPRIFHYKRPETTSVCLSRPLFNLEPRIKTFRRIGAEAVILAALTRAIAIDFVLLKPRSLGVCQSKKSSLLSNGDFVSRRVG